MKTITCYCGKDILLDDDAPAWIFNYKWNCIGGCAVKSGSDILSHYLLPNPPPGLERDHKDRNYHNNQLSNLRFVTRSLNQQNRSVSRRSSTGYRGVTFCRARTVPFRASAMVDKKNYHIGYYETPEEAAKAYDLFIVTKLGPDALLNFPPQSHEQVNN